MPKDRYDKQFNEYCAKLKEEQEELKSVVNGQILSRFPRLMAFKIRTRMQEDSLIKVDENVDEKKDRVLMQFNSG
jgi:hypothetical protein